MESPIVLSAPPLPALLDLLTSLTEAAHLSDDVALFKAFLCEKLKSDGMHFLLYIRHHVRNLKGGGRFLFFFSFSFAPFHHDDF